MSIKFDRERYFFIHLPKTAGTKVRSLLYGEFEQSEIYPNLEDISANGGAYPSLERFYDLPQNRRDSVRLFTGHYNYYDALKMVGMPSRCFTFLREPIDRSISQIFHVLRYSDLYKGQSIEHIIDNMFNELSNYQTRYFIREERKKNLNATHLDEALSNILSLGYLGYTSRLIDGVEGLNRRYNWQLPLLDARVNENIERNDGLISDKNYQKLKEMNEYDIQIYKLITSQRSS